MASGFTYEDALHMPATYANRYAALARAWSIPESERESRTRKATAADVDAYS